MAGDKQNYKKALDKWDHLRHEKFFSVPRDIGRVAIFCSFAVIDIVGDKSYRRGKKDVKVFYKEALALADRLSALDYATDVILNASSNDFELTLQDPTVSDIITIGHGNISSLLLGSEDVSSVDWQDISYYSDHLKTGQFVQRQCGNFARNLSVPLGLFCVSDHTNVIAPFGMSFTPYGLDHPDNELLSSVTDSTRLGYHEAKEIFTY